MGAWFLTAFYMAWFTAFFCLLFAVCWLLVSSRLQNPSLILENYAAPIVAFTATLVISLLPFLIVYLPKVSETGGHSFTEGAFYLVWPFDLTNIGRSNYVWGWVYGSLQNLAQHLASPGSTWPESKLSNEHVSGFPLLLFTIIALTAKRAIARRTRDQFSPALRAFALATVIGWACTIQLGWFSPWHLIYILIPGAHGLRVVLRYQLFLILPALLIVVLVQRDRIGHAIEHRPLSAAAVAVMLIAEQLGAVESAQLSRAGQRELVELPPPPAGCTAFYAVKARAAEPIYHSLESDALYPHNVDAMFLAERWHVPTINGFSTYNPPDWSFASPGAVDYDARATRYAHAHHLHGLCRLNGADVQRWRRVMS